MFPNEEMLMFKRMMLFAVAALMLGAAACSGTDDSRSSTTEEAYCCLNGAYYDCPDGDAAQACFNDGAPGSCTRQPSNDDTCDS
jgi:hypothetical protein